VHAVTSRLSDPRMPGLELALNQEALLALLAEHLPECRTGLELLDAHVADVQYVPGRQARVLWKLRARDPATRRTGRQLIYVDALRDDAALPTEPAHLVARYRALRRQDGMAPTMPLRTPWLLVPQCRLQVCAFPLDPALPTLLDVVDPLTMKAALQRAWQPRNARVRQVRVENLSYTPEARAALRFEVLAEDKATGLPELRRFVGKLHVRRTPARLFAGHWAVWRASLGRVAVAPPVGYVAVSQLSLQEFLTGTRLSDLAGHGSFAGLLRYTARAIAKIHSLKLPLLTVRGVEKEIAAVDRWVDILSRLRPCHSGRLAVLGERLSRELAHRTLITGTVHADFHLANVLADARRVTLIDWDQVAHGDPMADVGRLLASLRMSSLRVHSRLDGFADAGESFLEAYLSHTGEDERRARLFEAAALLISAAGPFRLQRKGWEESAELMLDEVERVLETSMRGSRVTAVAQTDPQIPFAARSRWAQDPPYAQALLMQVVHQQDGADVEVTECVPKPGSRNDGRLHIRWQLKGYRGNERWRAEYEGLGFPDHSGRGLLRRLETVAAVLHGDPDALQLPRPIGHLAPLSLIVFTRTQGTPLTHLLDTDREADALQSLAHALARFERLNIDLAKERETRRAIRAVGRRADRLRQSDHPSAPLALELLDRIEPLLRGIGERRLPAIAGLEFRHIRLREAGVCAAVMDDVLWGEPLLGIGELLADLRTHATERHAECPGAGHLSRVYADASGTQLPIVAAFEILALVRRACRRGVKNAGDPLVAPLLESARTLLDGQDAQHRSLTCR
jgi:aminoglycoside phosphotransferase (APT) family kinase protein